MALTRGHLRRHAATMRGRWVIWVLVAVAGLAAAVGVLFTREPPEPEVVRVEGVAPGSPLPVYLSDGFPAWVVAHDDGSLDLVSGMDAHRPFGIRLLLGWCPASNSFEGTHTGSKFDEYGVKYDGPAPHGLETWPLERRGDSAVVGSPQPVASIGTPHVGPSTVDRIHCFGEVPGVIHEFAGWYVWDSPSALAESAPEGWRRLSGVLLEADNGPIMCAVDGCADAIRVTGAEVPSRERAMATPPWPETQWLVRVENGRIVELARPIRLETLPQM